jgi:hypothetical protein
MPERKLSSKKKAAIAVVLAAAIVVAGVTVYLALPPGGPQPKQFVQVYVFSPIYASIASDIAQYEQDVEAEGYDVEVVNWTYSSATNLKANLTQAYLNRGLIGAVLVSNMDYQLREETPGSGITFSQDLYFMDLDGSWLDTGSPGNGIIDTHIAGTGDTTPEIWISRIQPETLTTTNITGLYHSYFARLHAYRTGALSRPHRMLLYQEDNWANLSYLPSMTGAYSDITFYNTSTTASNYLSNITTSNYEFVHLFCHADATTQYHEPWSSPTNDLTSAQINASNIQPLFYNLYCCSGADFLVSNCLATTYLFTGSTLTVIGSGKNNGGMSMNHYFYNPLGRGEIIGEAFRQWWTPDPNYYHGPNASVSMGVCLFGDPLLKI